jgi:GGDEF domain-containing protein
MLSMLTQTVASVSFGSDRAITNLRDIEKRLERASVIEDVRMLRLQMEQCLESIRTEIRAHEERATALVALRERIEESPTAGGDAAPIAHTDHVTGLPARPAAESAIMTAVQDGRNFYTVADCQSH